jgi:hypothetical protein
MEAMLDATSEVDHLLPLWTCRGTAEEASIADKPAAARERQFGADFVVKVGEEIG